MQYLNAPVSGIESCNLQTFNTGLVTNRLSAPLPSLFLHAAAQIIMF